jgi:mannose-1-phosphate guanylyltransferase/phosphomannomutase
MVRIIIVAGGEGTRMGPITETIPKCLVDIYGKPLIQHQLEFFRKKGYEDIIFCVAHFADKVRGTAGSVKLAEGLIADDEDFIVYYGDNLTTMDVNKFIKFHKEKDSIATICIRPLPEGYKSSSIIIPDENNRIKVFLEKPPIEEIGKYKDMKRYINSGIYAFKKKVFELIPKNQKYDFAKQLFPLIIEKNLGIYGYVTTEFFREIGRVGKYEKFLKEFKGKKNILV